MKTFKEYTVFLLILLSGSEKCNAQSIERECDSPQYLELGKSGTISCNFYEFSGVLWYTRTDFENGIPGLRYQRLVKSGDGFESGEFDVHSNGSLIINHVLLKHEDVFTVAYILPSNADYNFIDVRVIVLVKSEVPFPVIGQCGNDTSNCFAEIDTYFLQCSVRGVRPNVSLELIARTIQGDKVIPTSSTIFPEAKGYTTRLITTDIFRYSRLVLLVCKASWQPGILKRNESSILALNRSVKIPERKIISTYVEHKTRMLLKCTDYAIGFIVWKKKVSGEFMEDTVLLYSLFTGERFTQMFTDDFTLGENNSLVADYTEIKHEGMYSCTFGDGVSDGVTMHNVTVVVYPEPSYPVIDGCGGQEFCVLIAQYTGTLTCTVKGIRPRVQLRWKTFHDSEATLISFTSQTNLVDNGDTFDVTVVSQYQVTDKSRDSLTVECEVVTANKNVFELKTTTSLHFVEGNLHPTEKAHVPMTTIILTFVVTVVATVAAVHVCIRKKKNDRVRLKNRMKTENEETIETMAMLSTKKFDIQNFSGLKKRFLKEIRGKYKDLYDAVQPIPYIKDRLYCVDKVFVEGGIEFLESAESVGRRSVWKSLETYENVFNDQRVKSTRRILAGEPGYGKSTVTLQFAYDWCNPKPTSALKDVEILILLRLRQLGGVPSIYQAIKRFILPKDTTLSEHDIECILHNCSSVVVILDGFDEYPDRDSTTITDVMTIIAREMFQDFEVVTTTRSSFLPKKYPPLTKQVRLTGFDDNARRYYIRKAVVGEDDKRVQTVEKYLVENPILKDLCQVPLLFVIFAHMTDESEHFRKLNSVTSFFRYMISCFHSHMRNKMEEENVIKYKLFETDHTNLNKVAFEALSGDSQRIVWEKYELCQQLGQEFYDQYIRIGILVEEEVIDIIDDPGTPITEHVQYKTEVRFYHKLFCEWYAAHFLSEYIQHNPIIDLSEYLRHLDPFDVQYLYRFSCGLNSNSSEKIIDYLKNFEGGDKFAILCILEQTGKIDNIKETIRQLCFEGVVISGHDSLLLQRSSMQLLEIAARNDILIRGVILHNCFQSVDLSTSAIRTTSGLVLTSRIPVQGLSIRLYNKEMTEDEYIDILEFSSMCPSLRKLGVNGSAPPRSFKVGPALSTLCSRNVTVTYGGTLEKSPDHILNLLTGRWERKDDGLECAEEDFERMNLYWAEGQEQDWDDEYNKRIVQKAREENRRFAEEEQKNEDKSDNSDDDDDNDGVNLEDENHN